MTNMIESGESLMTVAEVAGFLRLHPNTVRAKIAAGEIPSLRLGAGPMSPLRIPRDQLEAKLAGGSFPPAEPDARGSDRHNGQSTPAAARGTTNGNANERSK